MNGYIKRSVWFGIGLFACLAIAQPLLAASFDCAKASTNIEKMICADAGLSKLDEELNAAYKTALQDAKQSNAIKQTQKQWMKERNGCEDAACVKRAYEARLHELAVTRSTSGDSIVTKPEPATPTVQAKVEAPTQLHVEESCLAPKIDWRNYEWTLIRGSGQPICEEMLAYVKSRPKDAAPPTCPEERLPSNGNWARPEISDLREEERQAILRDIPERFRQKKPGGPVSHELEIKSTKLLRVIRGDITRDGIPESFLAFGRNDDYRQTCKTSKRCARPEEIFNKGIVLTSDAYDLLPMNDAGTQVNWSHRTVGAASTPTGGELIFYKNLPYWMTPVSWDQDSNDDFTHYKTRPNDPYSAIFTLSEIFVGTGKQGSKNPNFKDVTVITMEYDPESNNVCRLGYFHRDNLKQNPPKTRR